MSGHVKFPSEKDAFYDTLKDRVKQHFTTNGLSTTGDAYFFFKTFFFLAIYLALYATLILSSDFTLAFASMILIGPVAILIGVNLAHDGAHGSISEKKWINSTYLFLLDILGANSYMWKNRHVFSHHIFPNILNSDADLKQNPLVRIFPDDKLERYHRFQFLYAPFLYLLYTMNWLLFRDFQDFTQERIGSFVPQRHPKKEIVKLIFYKGIYLSYILLIPMLFSVLTWPDVLLAYVLMNFSASLLITLALIPSHVAEDSNFPLPDENGMMPHSWSHHQVHTATDFATSNKALNFLFGGFNHHVAHHLFPHICHTHYTKITPIIKQTTAEFGLPYQHEDSFLNAYISHYKLLKNNGRPLSKVTQ